MMRSPMISNLEIISESEPPTHIDGIAVKKSWNEAGTTVKSKKIIISYYGGFRVAKCPDGYVILCSIMGCKNLGSRAKFKCVTHHRGDDVYSFCKNDTCVTTPLFGLEYKKPFFCFGHKEPEMYDVMHEKCLECPLRPNFGSVNGKAQYCFTHKKDDMGDITHKKCEDPNCNSRPAFGYKDHKVRFCERHKLTGMYNTTAKICE